MAVTNADAAMIKMALRFELKMLPFLTPAWRSLSVFILLAEVPSGSSSSFPASPSETFFFRVLFFAPPPDGVSLTAFGIEQSPGWHSMILFCSSSWRKHSTSFLTCLHLQVSFTLRRHFSSSGQGPEWQRVRQRWPQESWPK